MLAENSTKPVLPKTCFAYYSSGSYKTLIDLIYLFIYSFIYLFLFINFCILNIKLLGEKKNFSKDGFGFLHVFREIFANSSIVVKTATIY